MLLGETVPGSLAVLLGVFRSCFTAPSFATFTALVIGLIAQTGPGTVCGMLTGAGLAETVHHDWAHRFFARARWCPDRLGLALLGVVVDRLLDPEAPVTVAVDDSLFRRCGRKVHGAAWHHDATSPHRRGGVAWGNDWVVVGVLVRLPFATRPTCLPVLARLWRPGSSAHKSVLARELVTQIAAACPGRVIHVVADAYYGTRHWRGLDTRVSLTVRLRANAALTEINIPTPGVDGRPKLRGARIGTPTELARRGHWQHATVTRYGRTDTVATLDYLCLWTGPLLSRHLRVVLVRDTGGRGGDRGYDLALATTDLTSPVEHIIGRYAARWAIEVTFGDAKHVTGVGQARNRVRDAVERTVPFGLCVHSLVIIWYTTTGHHPNDVADRRQTAPWYRTKTCPSYQDMLAKLRRTIIAARFRPATPRPPTHEETQAVHQAWAHAAA